MYLFLDFEIRSTSRRNDLNKASLREIFYAVYNLCLRIDWVGGGQPWDKTFFSFRLALNIHLVSFIFTKLFIALIALLGILVSSVVASIS